MDAQTLYEMAVKARRDVGADVGPVALEGVAQWAAYAIEEGLTLEEAMVEARRLAEVDFSFREGGQA